MPSISCQEAEIGVIAAILESPASIYEAQSTITSDDFATDIGGRSVNGEVFALLCKMDDARQSLHDVALVIGQLRDAGLIDRLGGLLKFQETYLRASSSENVSFYARAVRQHAATRKLQDLQARIAQDSVRPIEDPLKYARALRSELESIEQSATATNHIMTLGEACTKLHGEIIESKATDAQVGFETGCAWFDERYALHPQKLYVVAARPGGGKTSLGQQWAEAIAARNVGTLLVSLEMSAGEIAARYLSRQLGLNGKTIANHVTSNAEDAQISSLASSMENLPFFISEPSQRRQMTTEAICAEVRLMAATKDVRVAVIDYLQILEPEHERQSEYEKVTLATRAFKQLSRELNMPIVLLSQLSRKGESEKDVREPRLSDLRSSGSIEQDADAVLFLHQVEPGIVKLIVAKMRGGELAETMLRFDGPTCTFSEHGADQQLIEVHPEFEDYSGGFEP